MNNEMNRHSDTIPEEIAERSREYWESIGWRRAKCRRVRNGYVAVTYVKVEETVEEETMADKMAEINRRIEEHLADKMARAYPFTYSRTLSNLYARRDEIAREETVEEETVEYPPTRTQLAAVWRLTADGREFVRAFVRESAAWRFAADCEQLRYGVHTVTIEEVS
jgi:hypothetical protein